MKLSILVVVLLVLFIALPVYADDQVALWGIGDDCSELQEDMNRCGQKVVTLGVELETLEQESIDKRHDAVAIAVGVGLIIGSGGLPVILETIGGTIGGIIGFPFTVLGF